MARAVLVDQLRGRIARGVVDHHHLGPRLLGQRGRQRAPEHGRLVDAQQEDRDAHAASLPDRDAASA
jgi:hypothetical protein